MSGRVSPQIVWVGRGPDEKRVHAALRGDRIDDDDAESMPGIVLEEEIECTKA